MDIDKKTKEQTEYLFNQIEPFLDGVEYGKVNKIDKDVRHIIYKVLKVFNQCR